MDVRLKAAARSVAQHGMQFTYLPPFVQHKSIKSSNGSKSKWTNGQFVLSGESGTDGIRFIATTFLIRAIWSLNTQIADKWHSPRFYVVK